MFDYMILVWALAGAAAPLIAIAVQYVDSQRSRIQKFTRKEDWERLCTAYDYANVAYECGYEYPLYYIKVKAQWTFAWEEQPTKP
jgi:hypothetical protein